MVNPTLYRPEYCEALIEHFREGGTASTFGGTVGVCRKTVDNWKTVHPEFAKAADIGEQIGAFECEKVHRKIALEGGKCPALEFRMMNLGRNAWRRVQVNEVSGPGGSPLETVSRIERVIVDPVKP
jgi:hypothetical protein